MADMQVPEDFGTFLKHAMSAARLPTAPKLGAAAGLDASVINRWIRNETVPTIDNLRQIAPHIGVPLRELVVAAGHMTRAEAGLDAEPSLPSPQLSAEDMILNDTHFSDDKKQALIAVLKAMRAEYAENPPTRKRKSA